MKYWLSFLLAGISTLYAASPISLFDGRTFKGWEGDTNRWWRIEDGALVGGSLEKRVPHNDFLATTRNFTNFIFRCRFRLLGSEGFVNSGIQIRSQRVPNSHEMRGYQCDIGDPNWWGSIYDESRRNRVLAQSDMDAINKVLKRNDWNEYVIRAEGPRIRTYINGVLGVDYTESDDSIVQWGRIGFQIHGGGAAEAWFKEITIEELPPTKVSPLSPEEEAASFQVPEGFEVELVASEPDLPKPITVTWDDAGRMWAITALEYPVDANESPARSERLFREGGRDKVLVFDDTSGPGPHRPRVFADGLAMPLGLLPYPGGAFVQYGSKILFLRDTDQDGRADQREVILEGFGVQDSHLFPHQFMRANGGWIYLAQGAFNYSRVRTRSGQVIRFDRTKLARFRPDGSAFEVLTHGPCNIWGLVQNRFGEMFIQEANDYGYSVVSYQPGINLPGCAAGTFRPYAPIHPSEADFRMGGTGLSGLALSEDPAGFPDPWREVMFVANPIIRAIQSVRIHRHAGGYRMEKLPDFLTSTDDWFRPVAIHFGPDGALYVVDWYNKIISHNEVPRNHPDRDKTRGRVWRVRHRDSPRRPWPNVAGAETAELLQHLQSSRGWEWRAALNQIGDRPAVALIPRLEELTRSTVTGGAGGVESSALQIRVLWALEDLDAVTAERIRDLLSHTNRNVRREAVRVARTSLDRAEAVDLVARVINDPDHQVRTEVIRTLSGQAAPWTHLLLEGEDFSPPLSHKAILHLVSMVQPALPDPGKPGPGYQRALERYLIRAALERDPARVAALLDSSVLPSDFIPGRRLACKVLQGPEAARLLGGLLREERFAPDEEEWVLLARHRKLAEVQHALSLFPTYPHERILQAVASRPELVDADRDKVWLAESVRVVLAASYVPAKAEQAHGGALEVVRQFDLRQAEPELIALLEGASTPESLRVGILRALRDIESGEYELLYEWATRADASDRVRLEALSALAGSPHPDAAPRLLRLWPVLPADQRASLMNRLSQSRAGALALMKAARKGVVMPEELTLPVLEKLKVLLEGNPDMKEWWQSLAGQMEQVLRLSGGAEDYVDSDLRLEGPFTVECWVRLDPGIDNQDGILGAPGGADLNFYNEHFRFYGGPGVGDLVVARQRMFPEIWTHVAVTRGDEGRLSLYINGELDGQSERTESKEYAGLDIGRTIPGNGGTAGELAEFRVWEVERTPAEILADFDRRFTGETMPVTLRHYFGGDGPWGVLQGQARVTGTLDPPPLMTAAQARVQQQTFQHYLGLARGKGDPEAGRRLFELTCQVCHQVGGQGANLAPPLDGSAHRDTASLLRALLTPNAAVEAGYRKFRVETTDGELFEGFLVSRDPSGIVLAQPNVGEQRIPSSRVRSAGFVRSSLMPEGLLEGMTARQVSDLFAYLRTLR